MRSILFESTEFFLLNKVKIGSIRPVLFVAAHFENRKFSEHIKKNHEILRKTKSSPNHENLRKKVSTPLKIFISDQINPNFCM